MVSYPFLQDCDRGMKTKTRVLTRGGAICVDLWQLAANNIVINIVV